MKPQHCLIIAGAAATLALFAGCGNKHESGAAHDNHDHAEHSGDNHTAHAAHAGDAAHTAHSGDDHAAHTAHTAHTAHSGDDHAAHAAHSGDDHAAHAGDTAHTGDETGQSVSFKEGRGLRLSPEVIRALVIKTADATEHPLAAELNVSAQIIATAPRIIASARVPEAESAALEKASPAGAKLLLADRSATQATRFVDLVFEIAHPPPPAPPPATGSFVTLALTGEPATVLAVPRSAVLETAADTFVYVVNGGTGSGTDGGATDGGATFLRVPVRTGARSPSLVEITDGLHAGDIVAVSPVEQLWLAELRLTKGGGHSH